jgi:hypothetical protein
MRTEVSAISFIGTSLRRRMVFLLTTSACFKAVAAFFSTGHTLDTLVAQLVGGLLTRARSVAIISSFYRRVSLRKHDMNMTWRARRESNPLTSGIASRTSLFPAVPVNVGEA